MRESRGRAHHLLDVSDDHSVHSTSGSVGMVVTITGTNFTEGLLGVESEEPVGSQGTDTINEATVSAGTIATQDVGRIERLSFGRLDPTNASGLDGRLRPRRNRSTRLRTGP